MEHAAVGSFVCCYSTHNRSCGYHAQLVLENPGFTDRQFREKSYLDMLEGVLLLRDPIQGSPLKKNVLEGFQQRTGPEIETSRFGTGLSSRLITSPLETCPLSG